MRDIGFIELKGIDMKMKESQKLEFKESLSLKEEIGEAVSAFSNAKGGRILIGVTDKGAVIGVQHGKKTLHDMANFIKQNTDPHVYPEINIKKMSEKDIIEIVVEESIEKPVFLRGKAYKRVGNVSNRIAVAEIKRLLRHSEIMSWDLRICKKASSKDIDSKFLKKYFLPAYERMSKTRIVGQPSKILESIGCLINGKPTNGGFMLFGKDPQLYFMNSYIALVRYKGVTIDTERLDYKEFTGNIFKQVDACGQYIKEHIATMSRQDAYKTQRDDLSEYGLFSIRELITNAVCHRDYENQHSKVIIKMFDDRIEFESPGGLPDHVTPSNITNKQFSRNPVIAKALAKLGYIEELGEGWDKIIKEHKEHPLKPRLPKIESDDSSTSVMLFSVKHKFQKEKLKAYDLNSRQKKALNLVLKEGRISNKEYRHLFPGITDRTVLNDLKDMVKKGALVRTGKTKGAIYRIPK